MLRRLWVLFPFLKVGLDRGGRRSSGPRKVPSPSPGTRERVSRILRWGGCLVGWVTVATETPPRGGGERQEGQNPREEGVHWSSGRRHGGPRATGCRRPPDAGRAEETDSALEPQKEALPL